MFFGMQTESFRPPIVLFQFSNLSVTRNLSNHFPHRNQPNNILLTGRIDSPREENVLSPRREYFTLARGIVSPREENIHQTK